MTASGRADRVLAAGLWLTVAWVLAQAAAQIIDFGVYDLRLRALDSNLHWSVFGVASLVAQAGAAAAVAARAASTPEYRGRWLGLAGLIAALLLTRVLVPYNAALLIAPTGLAFVLCWWLSGGEAATTRRIIRAALCLLAFSFLIHAVGPKLLAALDYGATTWAYQFKGILKHMAELGGWALLATGALAATVGPGGAGRGPQEPTGRVRPQRKGDGYFNPGAHTEAGDRRGL